jgi:hypothetical protein
MKPELPRFEIWAEEGWEEEEWEEEVFEDDSEEVWWEEEEETGPGIRTWDDDSTDEAEI